MVPRECSISDRASPPRYAFCCLVRDILFYSSTEIYSFPISSRDSARSRMSGVLVRIPSISKKWKITVRGKNQSCSSYILLSLIADIAKMMGDYMLLRLSFI